MTGQFNVIAEIADGQEPLFTDVANESLILKTFRDHSIMSKGSDRLEPNAHLNVLKQYKDLLEAEVPVAKIYNADEAEAGCGYFLLEKIPHPFEMAWAKGAPLADLSDEAKEQLAQLKDIFAKSYQHRIIADLQPGNLRVRDNCELVLTDLRENKIDDCELDLTFKQMLTFFNCKNDDEIYRYLNPME